MTRFQRGLGAAGAVLLVAAPAFGWGAYGHRTITYLAIDALPASMPAWIREQEPRQRIAYQSSEPDRWRGWDSPALAHENEPDHYVDVELLDQFGLTLDTVPRLRGEYLRALVVAKHEHPDQVDPYDAAKDPNRSKEWPGFALHAIAEHYAKLQSSFNQVQILEELNDPERAAQLRQARENSIYHMGVLAHFVGDMSQPLHSTRHYNGWVGPNPKGYTWRDRFHAYIDTGVLEKNEITYESVRPLVKADLKIDGKDPWDDVAEYVRHTFAQVEPLYRLETDGKLDGPDGKELIQTQMAAGASMLSAMYREAWRTATPTPKQSADFVRYGESRPASSAKAPPPESQPSSQ